ncbi:hypothetical protein LF1_16720 [Rubripirellula obstinata]|uniref:Uncharacterized protein n=1 Tax=Rubripirellula obstinata TaxID=406547 RepID=A0A5B1CIN6_9BACT|nr:hypothetical protein LF1_16720 [Rubripirellula obstinata]
MAANCTVVLPCSFSRYETKQMGQTSLFYRAVRDYCHEQTIMCIIELNSYEVAGYRGMNVGATEVAN